MDKAREFHEWLKSDVAEAKEIYDYALATDKNDIKSHRERWVFSAIILGEFERIMGYEGNN